MHSPVEQSGKAVMLAKDGVLKLMWQLSCTTSKWLNRGSAAGAWSFPFRGTLSILYWTLPRSWLPLDCQWLGYFSRLPSTIPVPCEFLPFFVILDGFPTDIFDSLYLVSFSIPASHDCLAASVTMKYSQNPTSKSPGHHQLLKMQTCAHSG